MVCLFIQNRERKRLNMSINCGANRQTSAFIEWYVLLSVILKSGKRWPSV